MKKAYHTVDLTPKVKEKLMALSEAETQKELQDQFDEIDQQLEQSDKEYRKRSIISWVTSLSLHITVLALAGAVYFASTQQDETELPPISIVSMPEPIKDHEEDKKKKERDLIENPVPFETTEDNNQTPVVVTLEELPELNTSEDETEATTPKGREEAVSDKEMGGNGAFSTIGANSGGAGMFGNRNGGGKLRGKQKMGGWGKPADGSTDAGLRWLKRHQSDNGMWSATRYYLNCKDALQCEPGKDASGDEDVAMTGYAVLCFLGAGYDHKTPNKFRKVVKSGIDYLVAVQKPDGLLGERNYEHPVATMALVEAYAMTSDPELRSIAQKAVDVIVARQAMEKADDPYSGLLWDYVNPNPKRCDNSINGWVIMALKSAVGAGLNTGNTMQSAKKSIERVWKAANPNWEKLNDPYTDVSIFPYTWNAITNETQKDHLSFVGATCSVFLGHKSGDIMLETLVNDSINRWITSGKYKQNSYSVYYLSMALFQMGGDRWKLALDTLIPNSIVTQRNTEDCFDGSWDYSTQQWHGSETGRVLATCYNILNLEVAYRYAQVNPDVHLPKR